MLAGVIAPIDLELAEELSPRAKITPTLQNGRNCGGRDLALRSSSPTLEASGHGDGFPLVSLAPTGESMAMERPSGHRVAFSITLSATRDDRGRHGSVLQFAIVGSLAIVSAYSTGGGPGWQVIGMVRFFFERRFGNSDEGDSSACCSADHGACFAGNGSVESNRRPCKTRPSWRR